MRRLFLLLVLFLFSLIGLFYTLINDEVSLTGSSIVSLETGFVGKVIDGDTVVINGESIRLLGIDTDERGYPCFNEAKKRIEELVLNKEVTMEKDVQDKDQYKRLLRYIFVENEGREINVNLQMAREGLAIARFYEDRKYKEEILAAEKEARLAKRGCKWEGV